MWYIGNIYVRHICSIYISYIIYNYIWNIYGVCMERIYDIYIWSIYEMCFKGIKKAIRKISKKKRRRKVKIRNLTQSADCSENAFKIGFDVIKSVNNAKFHAFYVVGNFVLGVWLTVSKNGFWILCAFFELFLMGSSIKNGHVSHYLHSKFKSVRVAEIQWKFTEFQCTLKKFSGCIMTESQLIFIDSQRQWFKFRVYPYEFQY